MEYDSTKNYQHKKPKIMSRIHYGTPFHHTSSPKLSLKHSAQRKLIHDVGMDTVLCVHEARQRQYPYTLPTY